MVIFEFYNLSFGPLINSPKNAVERSVLVYIFKIVNQHYYKNQQWAKFQFSKQQSSVQCTTLFNVFKYPCFKKAFACTFLSKKRSGYVEIYGKTYHFDNNNIITFSNNHLFITRNGIICVLRLPYIYKVQKFKKR